MATLQEIITYSKNNPNTDYAKQAYNHIKSGAFDEQAKQEKIDLSFAGRENFAKPKALKIAEKVLDVTGGKELGQGFGQAIANIKTNKEIDKAMTDSITQQTKLLKQRKEIVDMGGDTMDIDKALQINKQNTAKIAGTTEKLLNKENLTEKQVLGDALQLATTVGTIGTVGAGAKPAGVLSKVPGLTKGAPAIAKTLTKSTGVLKGAGTGLVKGTGIGAGVGALQGTAQGLQEDKGGKELLKSTGKGALVGGITGGIVGGVTGGISGGVKASKLSKETEHLKAITPDTKDLSPDEYRLLVRKGKISSKTAKSPDKYILSKDEVEVANKYKSLLGKDPVKNTHNIIQEIEKKDTDVGKFLKSKNGVFNTGELRNSLAKKLAEVDDLTVDEKRLSKLKKSTIDNFIKSLKKNDMESLWKARKEFDRKIESAFSGSPTLQKEIKKEFRNAVQDFISERTDDVTYKGYMKDMSQLFNLADITDTKAVKEKGVNAIQLWIKRNPNKASTIKWLGGTGIVGGTAYGLLKN